MPLMEDQITTSFLVDASEKENSSIARLVAFLVGTRKKSKDFPPPVLPAHAADCSNFYYNNDLHKLRHRLRKYFAAFEQRRGRGYIEQIRPRKPPIAQLIQLERARLAVRPTDPDVRLERNHSRDESRDALCWCDNRRPFDLEGSMEQPAPEPADLPPAGATGPRNSVPWCKQALCPRLHSYHLLVPGGFGLCGRGRRIDICHHPPDRGKAG